MNFNVCIAVYGRFHAFNLAYQLQNRSNLHSLISTYPSFGVSRFEIDPKLYKSIWYLEFLSRTWSKTQNLFSSKYNLQLWFLENFDRAVVNNLTEGFDIFVGWSGACYWSLKKAKEMGGVTVIERGSSHMAYQTEILTEEHAKWGINFNATHPEVYEREIQSYEDADYISIPSLFVKRTFIEKGIPESKLIHVPYGTSLREFYPVPKEDNVFRVIHCGSSRFRKGVQYLLQAFHELDLPDAELWLVGSISEEIKPFLAKYDNNRIICKGHQPQTRLRWFYSQCSVFCLASIEEGLAMVQPQAMACGLPIIHTTNTGGEDIVRDGIDGFCIPIRDVEAIKEKILFFYENPDLCTEMGRNALKQATTSYTWDHYGEKIIKAYESVLR